MIYITVRHHFQKVKQITDYSRGTPYIGLDLQSQLDQVKTCILLIKAVVKLTKYAVIDMWP